MYLRGVRRISGIVVELTCDPRHKVIPLGSFSRIEELPPAKSSYEL
jgi:hypothetical protein